MNIYVMKIIGFHFLNTITSRYIFGEDVIDGMSDFDIQTDKITNKSNKEVFDLNSTLPYKDYL